MHLSLFPEFTSRAPARTPAEIVRTPFPGKVGVLLSVCASSLYLEALLCARPAGALSASAVFLHQHGWLRRPPVVPPRSGTEYRRHPAGVRALKRLPSVHCGNPEEKGRAAFLAAKIMQDKERGASVR